ncbi:MAG: hypothetical protein R2733_24570 [Acidimicrobiales bacterium]
MFIAWLTRGLRSADSPAVANGWLYFTFVAGISAAASLTFHRGPSNSAWPSDGRQILDTLKLTRAEIEERLSRTDWSVNAFEFHDLLLDGAGIAPTGILTAALADNGIAAVQIEPDDATANIRAAVALLLDERHADALQYAEKALALALALEDAEPADVAYYRNAVAYTLAVLAEPGTLERATSLAHLAYADAELPVIAGTLGACLVQTGEPERGEELIQMSISGIVRSADWFHTSRFLLIGALERRDTVAARRAFGESEAAAAVDTGVETGLLLRLLPRLGAAEAVHRLGWLSANQPLDASESGADARIAALALDAWLSTSLEDETRWRLFDEQGGSRLSVSEANLEALRSAAARLQAIGSV